MIIKDYINIDYEVFCEFDCHFLNIKNRLTGAEFTFQQVNDIEYIKNIFRTNAYYLSSKACDYDNMIFICFNSSYLHAGYDCAVFPFIMSIEYFNNNIKPKFDKYLKLKVFI